MANSLPIRRLQVLLRNSGLVPSEIKQTTSYFHFTSGFEPSAKTLVEREQTFDESIDVFPSIDEDQPRGTVRLI